MRLSSLIKRDSLRAALGLRRRAAGGEPSLPVNYNSERWERRWGTPCCRETAARQIAFISALRSRLDCKEKAYFSADGHVVFVVFFFNIF